MQIPFPYFKVLFNNRNITASLTEYIDSLSYTDKVSGESDEFEIALMDKDLRFQNGSYPEKGAKITLEMGMSDTAILNCGTFTIDQVELSGPPDKVSIKGIATGIDGKLKTKKSTAHENKTLRQIVNSIAGNNGYTVIGTIENISIGRLTQYRETDLQFLNRLANDYGYAFSVRDKTLVFTSVFELEAKKHILTIDKTDLSNYTFKDNTAQTYKSATVQSHNPNQNKTIKATATAIPATQEQQPFDVFDIATYGPPATANTDTYETREKTENESQAIAKSKAGLHKKNSKSKTFSGSMPGNVLMVSGINFELTGFGELSGIYHITESKHNISRAGYLTMFEAKRVTPVSNAKKLPKSTSKAKPAPNVEAKKPFDVFDISTY